MRVLLIAYAYPPAPMVGAFRAAKLVAAFRAEGHEVEVITACLSGERPGERMTEPGLRVHAVRTLPHPRHLYVWSRNRLRRIQPPADPGVAACEGLSQGAAAPPRAAWKRLLISLMKIPDDLQGFIPPALMRARPLLRGGVDLVYTTAPPFSDHLIGLLLKLTTRLPWAAEFRDPWSEKPEVPSAEQSRPANAVNRWLERLCLAHADHIITVAGTFHQLLAAKVRPERRDRVILALNGIDTIEPAPDPKPAPEPFRIVYTGTFSAGRDPRTFLQALASLRSRLRLTPADLQVEVIGRVHSYEGVSIEQCARELGIGDLITFRGWMPQHTARAHLRDADLLLLLFRDQRIQIPNKLYDYLGARRPILALVDPAGDAARMLREVGGHYIVTRNDAAAMERALETAYRQQHATVPASSEARLREWTTRHQMARLMEALGARAGGSEPGSAGTARRKPGAHAPAPADALP